MTWFAGGVLLQATVWRLFAPRPKCYLVDGICGWQVDQTSSPYFTGDVIFGAIGLFVGLAIGGRFARRWWSAGFRAQLAAAAVGLLGSLLAMRIGTLGTAIEVIDARTAFDAISLRSPAFLLAWPVGVQLAVVWRASDAVAEGGVEGRFEN